MLKRVLLFGDVGFYLAVLLMAMVVAPRTRWWYAGIALAAIAFPTWIVARLQLGSSFSFRPEARRLVTSGLYSRMRHPVYIFGTLGALSTLLTLQIWPLLALGGALIPITWFRARREEQVLGEAFGREYEEYRGRTWF